MRISIFRWLISTLYGVVTSAAAIVAIANNLSPAWVNILMALSAIGIIISNFNPFQDKLLFISCWLVLIHICAILNGHYTGGNNLLHHIVRLAVSIFIFALFYFSRKSKQTQNK